MGNKSNAARRNRNKRQGSPFESQNEPTAVASSSKRVKRSKQTDHIDDNEQDVSTAHPRTETTPEDPIDHTRQYFKIMYCVMLGNTVVDEDTEKVRLGEFIYRQFDVQAIKNIDKAASKAHCGFEWESGNAVISARLVGKDNWEKIKIVDDASWRKVENFVEDLLVQGKQDVRVRLTVVYSKKRGQENLSSDDEETEERGKKKVTNFQFSN